MESRKDIDEVYSERVNAGKRVYFFDIKATRANDYYLSITESKKKPQGDGFAYEKHKLFLYKEDINKFLKALNGTVKYMKTELIPEYDFEQFDNNGNEDAN